MRYRVYVGPRGADINIGRHGVTTNAGIPGTGISYRSKLGGHGGKLGVLALVAGLGFVAFKNGDRIESLFQHPPKTVAAAASSDAVAYVSSESTDCSCAFSTAIELKE